MAQDTITYQSKNKLKLFSIANETIIEQSKIN